MQSLTRFASRKSKTLAHDSLIIIPYQIYQCRIQNLSTDDSDDSDDPNRPRQFMAGGLEGSEAQQKSLGQALSECSGELQRQMAAVMLTQAAAMAVMAVVAVVVRGWSLIRSEVESVVWVQFAVLFIGCSRDVAGVQILGFHSKPCAEEAFVERRGRLQDERANLQKRMEVASGQTASPSACQHSFLQRCLID